MSDWDQTGADVPAAAPGWDTGVPGEPSWADATLRGMAAGQRVFGRFVLERVLGRGGMGVVWLARDEKLEQPVALKFLPETLRMDPVAVADLKRETRRSLHLTHPNIVRVYDYHEDGWAAAIAMEFVDGQTLSAMRAAREHMCLEVREVAPLIGPLCAALEYAHAQAKVVHRDLKPANVMLDRHGQLKVGDFGIARSLVDSMSRVSAGTGTSGTLVYMSPQQARGAPPSAADDIYSLGATLYDLLTGKPPFFSGNIQMQIDEVIPPPMAQRRVELGLTGQPIPLHWEAVVAACLAKEVARRPGGAAEVVARLEARGQRLGGAPSARHSTSVQGEVRNAETAEVTAERRERKMGSGVGAVIVAGLVLAAVGVGGWWLGYEAPRREAEGAKGDVIAPAVLDERLAAADQERQRQEALEAERQRMEAERLAKARGGLLVRTEPVGALVTVDGGEGKPGPAAFSDLKLGKHRVSVTADGYGAKELEAEVGEGKVTEVGPVVLEALTGTVRIESEPAGAAVVWADGRRLGVTPLKLSKVPAGEVSLRLELEGYEPKQVRGTAEAGRETSLTATLARAAPKPVAATKERPFENSLGMRFVPAGTPGVLFCIWETRVRDFEAFVRASGHDTGRQMYVLGTDGWKEREGYSWRNPGFEQGADHPVVGVSWEDAKAFCAWLTEKERREGKIGLRDEYRLPSEDEWNAGVGTSTYPWGSQWPPPRGAGNYAGEEYRIGQEPSDWSVIEGYRDGYARTAPVGSFPANGLGLYDLGGNVWEWCEDRYSGSGDARVLRGASWSSLYESDLRSSCRSHVHPGFRIVGYGFRCVLSVSGS